MKNTKKKNFIAVALLALSVASFAVAGYYFLKAKNVYDIYNYYLNASNNNPWPHNPPDWSYFYGFIEAWQTIGFLLTLIGIILLLITLVYVTNKKTSAAAMILILLSPLAAPRSLAVSYSPLSTTRWWVYHELQSPTDAIAGLADITPKRDSAVFDKEFAANETPKYSFVAFWLNLRRYDQTYPQFEDFQAGFMRNRTGFYVYAEISPIYAEEYHVDTQNMPTYFLSIPLEFAIYETDTPNHYHGLVQPLPDGGTLSIPISPGDGAIMLGEFTFNLPSKWDFYKASAESNNPYNYISYTHFSELRYWRDSMEYWNDIKAIADSPYFITEMSSKEFAAGGGYYGVQHRRSMGGGYILLTQDRPM